MSFKEFTANIQSVRDYQEGPLGEKELVDIIAYLREINAGIGSDKGFYFIMLEKGEDVFHELEGMGGYSGVMIKSPHYIALSVLDKNPEVEFYGAYYMQSIVKKLYDMNLGSCWINVRSIPQDKKEALVKNNSGSINYLLALGLPDEKAIRLKTPQATVRSEAGSYKENPYGIKINEASASDKARYSLGEIVYLHEWGNPASYEELERRGMTDIFFYVRNAPSYKNLQPYRLVLKDGETELAVLNPEAEGAYTDAGIMMYTLEGLAKDLGIPGHWHFVNNQCEGKEYCIAAKINL